jgi:hypothetical protein
MGTPKLNTPRMVVIMRDGAVYEVQALNIDLVSWDRDRVKFKWGATQEVPMQWMSYLAWHTLTKTQGLLPAMSLNEFENAVAAVQAPEDDDEGDDDSVGPTKTVPGPE